MERARDSDRASRAPRESQPCLNAPTRPGLIRASWSILPPGRETPFGVKWWAAAAAWNCQGIRSPAKAADSRRSPVGPRLFRAGANRESSDGAASLARDDLSFYLPRLGDGCASGG